MAKETTALAQYATFDSQEYQQGRIEEEANVTSFESFWLKLPSGSTILRVLPAPVAWADWYKARGLPVSPFLGFWEHFYQDPDTQQWINFVCPKRTTVPGQKGHQCPTCAKEYRLRTDGEGALDEELAKTIKAKYKIGCNVYVRSAEDPKFKEVGTVAGFKMSALSPQHRKKIREEGGQLTTRTLFEKLEAAFVARPGKKGKNIVDPSSKGYDIIVTKSGEGKNGTTYTVDVCDDPCPLHEDAAKMSEILGSQKDIRQHVQPATPAEMEALFGRQSTGTARQLSLEPASQDITEYITTATVTDDDPLKF